MSAENIRRLRRILLEGFGKGNMSVLDELVAESFVEHQAEVPHQGREGLKSLIASLRRAFPDLDYSVVQMVDDGDKVWGHFRGTGTHQGMFMGNGGTGRRIEIDVIDIARFENGMMVEHWGVPDRLSVLHQLGLLPARKN